MLEPLTFAFKQLWRPDPQALHPTGRPPTSLDSHPADVPLGKKGKGHISPTDLSGSADPLTEDDM